MTRLRRLKEIWKELAAAAAVLLMYLFLCKMLVPVMESFSRAQNLPVYLACICSAAVAWFLGQKAYEKFVERDLDIDEGWLGFSPATVLLGATASLAMATIVSCGIRITEAFVDNPHLTEGNMTANYSEWTGIELFALVILNCMLTPMVEETIFRGLFFSSLWKIMGLHKAVIVSSVCFGLLHGVSVATILSATLGGVVLAYVYSVNRNLWDSVMVHLSYNTAVNSSVIIRSFLAEQTAAEPVVQEAGEVIVSAVPMLLGAVAVIVMSWYVYRHKRGQNMACNDLEKTAVQS